MPDQVKAKMYLALGKSELRLITDKRSAGSCSYKSGFRLSTKAVELDDKCGGRGDLNLVQKLYDKFAPITNPTTETETNTGDVTASS